MDPKSIYIDEREDHCLITCGGCQYETRVTGHKVRLRAIWYADTHSEVSHQNEMKIEFAKLT